MCTDGVWKEASITALESGTELPSVRAAVRLTRALVLLLEADLLHRSCNAGASRRVRAGATPPLSAANCALFWFALCAVLLTGISNA